MYKGRNQNLKASSAVKGAGGGGWWEDATTCMIFRFRY